MVGVLMLGADSPRRRGWTLTHGDRGAPVREQGSPGSSALHPCGLMRGAASRQRAVGGSPLNVAHPAAMTRGAQPSGRRATGPRRRADSTGSIAGRRAVNRGSRPNRPRGDPRCGSESAGGGPAAGVTSAPVRQGAQHHGCPDRPPSFPRRHRCPSLNCSSVVLGAPGIDRAGRRSRAVEKPKRLVYD